MGGKGEKGGEDERMEGKINNGEDRAREGGSGGCSQGVSETWMLLQDVARNPKALSPVQGAAMPEGHTSPGGFIWGQNPPHHISEGPANLCGPVSLPRAPGVQI